MRIVMMFDFPALSERIREIVPEADILTLSPADPLDQEGRTSGGGNPVSPWGKPAKGGKTRKKSKSRRLIVKGRK